MVSAMDCSDSEVTRTRTKNPRLIVVLTKTTKFAYDPEGTEAFQLQIKIFFYFVHCILGSPFPGISMNKISFSIELEQSESHLSSSV